MPTRTSGRRLLSGALQVAAVLAGAAVLLERIPGPVRPWHTLYGEDYWMFLPQAIQHPWNLFIPYNGYEQFLPRVIAQCALYFPLRDAAVLFAVTGAVIAAACGLFVYHACEGHIRSRVLRVILGAAVVLLSVAPAEIADSGVDTPWYLLLPAFWALLWRPRTRTGIAVAAAVSVLTAASNILAVLFGPLIAIRLFALRRPRDHAVTAAWLAGCLIQAVLVLSGHTSGQDRLTEKSATGIQALAYDAHNVILPSLGWHLDWRLRTFFGENGATAVVVLVLLAVFGAILVTQPRSRAFVVTALATSFLVPLFSAFINGPLAIRKVYLTDAMGARYAVLPVFLLECAAVLGVDYLLSRRALPDLRAAAAAITVPDGFRRLPDGFRRVRRDSRPPNPRRIRPGAALAVALLIVVLGASWIADFRYPGLRSHAAWNWAPISARWQHDCEHSTTGIISEWVPHWWDHMRCSNIRF